MLIDQFLAQSKSEKMPHAVDVNKYRDQHLENMQVRDF